MANAKTNNATEIKTDLIYLVQRNYLEKKRVREEAEEIAERNAKAMEYSKSVEKEHKRNIVAAIDGALFFVTICSSIVTAIVYAFLH
jgi:hypothetical protein